MCYRESKLKKMRKLSGLTQAEVAKRAGIHVRTVQDVIDSPYTTQHNPAVIVPVGIIRTH